VLGGGYIGCELGQAYRRLGSRVTIIHGPELTCADEEPDVSRLLARGLRADGIELLLDHRALRVEPTAAGVRVTARADPDGSERAVEGSLLLVATGRRPNTDTLNLDAAGVTARPDGAIAVDDRLRTDVPGASAGRSTSWPQRSASSRRWPRAWRARRGACCDAWRPSWRPGRWR
jgi:pyruvate/2-oxoglutarate dehydrogenase complex dihydrolipoamide dehydrogenase (E3) component